MARVTQGKVMVDGVAEGKVLKLTAPICFWGGINTETSAISDPHHPEFGEITKDRVLAIPSIVGSSASSQLLLELMRLERAPAAILLGESEIIVATAVLVGREMNYKMLPVINCDLDEFQNGSFVKIEIGGVLNVLDG